ncbi:hypothetical protein D3C84_1128900 [compost metagenome]
MFTPLTSDQFNEMPVSTADAVSPVGAFGASAPAVAVKGAALLTVMIGVLAVAVVTACTL